MHRLCPPEVSRPTFCSKNVLHHEPRVNAQRMATGEPSVSGILRTLNPARSSPVPPPPLAPPSPATATTTVLEAAWAAGAALHANPSTHSVTSAAAAADVTWGDGAGGWGGAEHGWGRHR